MNYRIQITKFRQIRTSMLTDQKSLSMKDQQMKDTRNHIDLPNLFIFYFFI